jgi:DNA-binding NarL/FixJ family response regulator
MNPRADEIRLRLLVVARQPLRLDDVVPEELSDEIDASRLIRRSSAIKAAIDEVDPNVVLVDTNFPGTGGFDAITEVLERAPTARVLALTPDPPPHADVARAVRAGAIGFIDVNAGPAEFTEAIGAVAAGDHWMPPEFTRAVLVDTADDLDVTSAERRSRLTGLLVAFIPLAGLIAALLSILWRSYLAQIGVRPVDLAIDPASRVIDAIFTLLLVVAMFGPLVFVGAWLDLLRQSQLNRGPIAWLLRHSRLAWLLAAAPVFTVSVFFAKGTGIFAVLVIGPIVTVALLARSIDLSDELPSALRIRASPVRTLVGALAVLLAFLAVLTVEVTVIGPDFGPSGARGFLAPTVLGFRAQPMQAYDVDTGALPRAVLYLGGNADLYVLVDPCNDDEVEFVSVGSQRLVVIDEVTCDPG